MIRKFETQDLDVVMRIWLEGNLDAHAFIPVSFWTEHFEMVRDMLPQAELYVHENEAPGKSTASSVTFVALPIRSADECGCHHIFFCFSGSEIISPT